MKRLLAEEEPAPFTVLRREGRSPFFLTCDHASNRLPQALGALGLSARDRERHIAWDIGAGAVARGLSEALGATLVLQNYSRLVIDCNRPFASPESIPERSENTEIPGNVRLSDEEIEARRHEIFLPYHEEIEALLDAREAIGLRTLLVQVHSFTPIYHGEARPWNIGLLYNRDRRLAEPLFEILRADPDLCVGDNEPYQVGDEHDYGTPVHGEGRGLLHVALEIRHDHIADPAGQQEWAELLAKGLERALEQL